MAMENIQIEIKSIKASTQKNVYKSNLEEEGQLIKRPYDYCLEVEAKYHGEIAYFTHKVTYFQTEDENGEQYYFDKQETDFVTFDGNIFIPKIKIGDVLDIRCQVFKKLSMKGNKYWQLKLVKMPKEKK